MTNRQASRISSVLVALILLVAVTGLVDDGVTDEPAGERRSLEGRSLSTLKMSPKRTDVRPFEYLEVGAKIPNYPPGRAWGEQAQPYTQMQKPLSPEESLKHIVVPRGFHVELFASEREFAGKPIAMAWDERGRLWVCETLDYPNDLRPLGQGRDRLRILEDTDGDGRADRSTVFAEGLSIPTAIAFHRGGVIVQNGIETWYLKDTDGDDRSDQKVVLFTGWDLKDTHGGVSNFRYGLDNWIWGMQGYNASSPVVRGKRQQTFRQGFFRFRPDGSELEFIRSTNNNTWGLGISEEGIVFGSTANRNPSVHMPIPNRYYERVRGWTPSLQLGTIADSHLFRPITRRVRQVDQHGGYTAGAGHALYTARRYPRPFWNRAAFVCGPTGHLVGMFELTREGSTFRSTSPANLFASDDEWTAPIAAEVGPDGNVWVLDWYNYIVQHNPTPHGFTTGKGRAYESDLRDKQHGRIYRVVYDRADSSGKTASRKWPARLDLSRASPAELVATLRHPTMLWRGHAQRLLVERGKRDVVPQLIELIRDRSVDEIGLNVGAIHALWTLHGLGILDGSDREVTEAVIEALRHRSAGVRRNAAQVLPLTTWGTVAIDRAELLDDEDAQVRLAALLALADRSAINNVGAMVWQAIEDRRNRNDRWLHDAIIAAAATHAQEFLRTAFVHYGDLSDQAARTEVVEVIQIVAEHYARGKPDSAALGLLIALLARADLPVIEAVTEGMTRGWERGRRVELDGESIEALKERLDRQSFDKRLWLLLLIERLGIEGFEAKTRQLADDLVGRIDEVKEESERIETMIRLIELDPSSSQVVEAAVERLDSRASLQWNVSVIEVLRRSTADDVGEMLIDRLPHLTPEVRVAAVRLLLSRPAWTRALLEGLDGGSIQLGELSLVQRQSLMAHPDRVIADRARDLLQRGGAVPDADRARVIRELLPRVSKRGDAVEGKQVYLKHCAKCHVHGQEGARIGPDLTGMAVHPKKELLTNIIDPNRSVESNFMVFSVLTTDGLVVSGLLASESKTAIELYDVEGKRRAILREDIEQFLASTKSLMPEGFEKQISPVELQDLLEFLTQRGKFVPIDLAKYATIASDRGMFNAKEMEVERLVFSDWGPKVFQGVPFQLVDPQGGRRPNVLLLNGPVGGLSSKMPKSVRLPCHGPAKALHLLSGISGWGYPATPGRSVSLIVRLHYADGSREDHPLRNAVHFADYIRRIDVPGSEFAFALRKQQIRYLVVRPRRNDVIAEIEFVKGEDRTAPVVMAVTIETRE